MKQKSHERRTPEKPDYYLIFPFGKDIDECTDYVEERVIYTDDRGRIIPIGVHFLSALQQYELACTQHAQSKKITRYIEQQRREMLQILGKDPVKRIEDGTGNGLICINSYGGYFDEYKKIQQNLLYLQLHQGGVYSFNGKNVASVAAYTQKYAAVRCGIPDSEYMYHCVRWSGKPYKLDEYWNNVYETFKSGTKEDQWPFVVRKLSAAQQENKDNCGEFTFTGKEMYEFGMLQFCDKANQVRQQFERVLGTSIDSLKNSTIQNLFDHLDVDTGEAA